MAEDQQIEIQKSQEPTEEQEQQSQELSPAETLAMEGGWKPKEQYNGDPAKWVSAEEFNRRGELFEKIDFQNREIKEMKRAMKEVLDHQGKIREQAYSEALKTLKAQKAQAVEEGDSNVFLKVEEQEEQLKEAWAKEKQEQKAQVRNGPSEVFTGFLVENPWYTKDQEQRDFADKIGIAYAKKLGIQPGTASPEQESAVLEYVVSKVKEKFTAQKKTLAVESGRGGASTATSQQSSKGVKESDLSPTEKRAMDNFVRWGVMSKAEYLKSIETTTRR